ncbi:IS4 family transposase [Cohnella rhizosphaerae]|uniref:IS4 family transposase n=1 Tax=Cohnella rhizosphaerae TaxID=1457232 RepID=A0A9X4KSJ7_9BACL|nr:IS4 family transposase [Cohnella rhizosphaerae]MDG0810165.1 IS4 family transposase [Cohnella rhizosphaerae]
MLPLADFSAPCLDYRVRKLRCANLLKVFIAAQICGWDSLRRIELEIAADPLLQQEFGCAISASQLCRRIDDFPSCVLEALFHALLSRIHHHTVRQKKWPSAKLYAVDSTNLRLPQQLADWTYVTRSRSGVKVHTRLAILPDGNCFPDRIVPSTGNVSDYEGSDLLVVDPDATYLLDRGYVSYKRMDQWLERDCHFVLRINTHHLVKQVLEAYPTDASDPGLCRDAIVYLGGTFRWMEHPVRLVEFRDEKGRLYRIATSRFDLSAREIADLYRQRWQVELFFRWMKQHLKFAKLYSYKPQAVWNHILLAMIAYSLIFLLKMQTKANQTPWQLLRLIRVYAFRSWRGFLEAASKVPRGRTKGRQARKTPAPPLQPQHCDVALTKPSKRKRR